MNSKKKKLATVVADASMNNSPTILAVLFKSAM
jgi:hypothetical protein